MKADCHIHMALDGVDWKRSVRLRQEHPDLLVHHTLSLYRDYGYTYLRDGGDKWGMALLAKEIAPRYGITYRTPGAPLCRKGHYGQFIGLGFETEMEFARLVAQQKDQGADFIKLVASGLMDYHRFGVITDEPMEPGLLRNLVRIAHEEGMAVMVHANGARLMEVAADAGVDSVEHGAYADADALAAMAERGVVWVPTLSTVGNLVKQGTIGDGTTPPALCATSPDKGRQENGFLAMLGMTGGSEGRQENGFLDYARNDRGRTVGEAAIDNQCHSEEQRDEESVIPKNGRFTESVVRGILADTTEKVGAFLAMGGLVAPGTDAGAWAVPHGCGTEEALLYAAGATKEDLEKGTKRIMEKF